MKNIKLVRIAEITTIMFLVVILAIVIILIIIKQANLNTFDTLDNSLWFSTDIIIHDKVKDTYERIFEGISLRFNQDKIEVCMQETNECEIISYYVSNNEYYISENTKNLELSGSLQFIEEHNQVLIIHEDKTTEYDYFFMNPYKVEK